MCITVFFVPADLAEALEAMAAQMRDADVDWEQMLQPREGFEEIVEDEEIAEESNEAENKEEECQKRLVCELNSGEMVNQKMLASIEK